MYNPCMHGWIAHYGHFFRTQSRPTLIRIDATSFDGHVRKFKRMRHQTKAGLVRPPSPDEPRVPCHCNDWALRVWGPSTSNAFTTYNPATSFTKPGREPSDVAPGHQ